MGDIEFESEAEPKAYIRPLLLNMEMGNIEGFPDPPRCLWCRYRLLYDGKQLDDDDFLDYIVAAGNPTVSVLVTQEPDPGDRPSNLVCVCPQCMPPSGDR